MDRLSLLQDILKGAKQVPPRTPTRKTAGCADDFISRVNGAKTCWPVVMLASAVIASSIILLISFALSNGAG